MIFPSYSKQKPPTKVPRMTAEASHDLPVRTTSDRSPAHLSTLSHSAPATLSSLSLSHAGMLLLQGFAPAVSLFGTHFLQITTAFTSSPPSGFSSNVTFLGRLSLTYLKLTSIPSKPQPLSLLYFCPSPPLDYKFQKSRDFCLLHCCISSIQNSAWHIRGIPKYLLNRLINKVVACVFKKKMTFLGQNKHKTGPFSWALPHNYHHEHEFLFNTYSVYQVLCWALSILAFLFPI